MKFRDYVPQGWGPPVAPERLELNYNPYVPSHDAAQIDLANAAGSRWKFAGLTDAQKTQAVKALTDQFVDAGPYWNAPDGTARPLATGVRETQVDVIGEWPGTLVRVTCRHPYFPTGRIRRSIRIFDDAGRIKFDRYASIQFREDLDTHALPELREARNGILDA
ncbi:hypothetical protein [Paenarthrobacter sp. Z7-10]|uniref:hypothetical protein n=1 Tax=Paenarthrobacter sp. Z7-10 TaxID=2787635 RepID=UPI0022A8FD82|nr:hypothetical protein [Paenarthrobacter sp. Z7-10]